jgi:hypothetical protein
MMAEVVTMEVEAMDVMPVMTAVHHMPHASAMERHMPAAAAMATATAGFGVGGRDNRHAGNSRYRKNYHCNALEHLVAPRVRPGPLPRPMPLKSLKARLAAVLAITKGLNPTPHDGAKAANVATVALIVRATA